MNDAMRRVISKIMLSENTIISSMTLFLLLLLFLSHSPIVLISKLKQSMHIGHVILFCSSQWRVTHHLCAAKRQLQGITKSIYKMLNSRKNCIKTYYFILRHHIDNLGVAPSQSLVAIIFLNHLQTPKFIISTDFNAFNF
jgi:hypothetical protein